MTYTERIKEAELRRFVELDQPHKDVLIVSGARQVGKTTLIEHVLARSERRCVRMDLEKTPSLAEKIDLTRDFDEFDRWLKDEFSFSPEKGEVLFIDESQVSRRLGGYVRFMKESWETATVILSGSLIGELHNEDVRQPVGREKFLELWPFTFKEFLQSMGHESLVEVLCRYSFGEDISELNHQRLLEDYDVYLKTGGLPAVIDAYRNGGRWQETILDIYKTYENDFVRYFGIENTNLFGRAISAVAAHIGSPSKNSQVIKVDAPGYKKVADILARLERWKLVIKVDQVGRAPEQCRFPPKRYLYDSGVLNYVRFRGRPDFNLSLVEDAFVKTAMGGVVENAVAISLRNQASDVVGIKLSKNSEIDFGVKLRDTFIPIECKASTTFKLQSAAPIVTYCSLFHLTSGIVLNLDTPREIEKGDLRIRSLPAYFADEIVRLAG